MSESFANAFAVTPEIAASTNRGVGGVANREYTFETNNQSTTGFDMIFRQMAANDRSTVTDAYAADYVATEGR